MMQRLIGSKLSLDIATAIASLKVGGSENGNLFTTFVVKRQVLCVDFAAAILGGSEMTVLGLSEFLRKRNHTLTEEHAKMLVAEAAVFKRTGVSDECTNFYFQEFDGHVGIGDADFQRNQWFYESNFFVPTAVFYPGSRVIIRSYAVQLSAEEPEHFAVGPTQEDSRVFDPGGQQDSFAYGLLDG